ncbi:site-specific integrase [Methylobacterium sp. WL8]|uniref:tyrosine-type recombinase/integrase n=2 Tax=unclassified Methylobacterium TaxID=2615210 RepID=UPI0011CAAFE3|nr:site-specific integrase [Methylobacterium sp. WL8]TXM66807.1 site-specific integrase [Methylobacterium sp. WL120]TXN10213.1 site-specific integrase [Methylobacterium sp. WL122]TXN83789.1 site-specific integrase [Methylobacterium sp. WL8]
MSTPGSPQAERYQLFQRSGSTKWQMRFSIRGQGQIKRSLDTSERAQAERKADEIWYEATYRAKQGLSAKVHTFEAVAQEFIELIHREVERGERRADQGRSEPSMIRRFFVGYFGSRSVDGITDTDLERYAEWRRTYWTEGPGKLITHIEYERAGHRLRRPVRRAAPSLSRQRGEAVVLRALLRQAVKWGYLKTPPEIAIKVRRKQDNRRPSFEPHEFTKLVETSLCRLTDPIMDGSGAEVRSSDKRRWQIKRLDDHTRRDRTVLHAYVMIGAYSGLRPTEMYNLTWGDVLGYRAGRGAGIAQRDIRLKARGKGMSGTAIPHTAAIPWFDTLWMLFERGMQREPVDGDPVFASGQGKRISSIANGFTELLKAADLERDHRGIKRTPYSLRHFYITQQLTHGAEVTDIARNCRTSLAMIDKHYGQVRLERVVDRLRPDWTRA